MMCYNHNMTNRRALSDEKWALIQPCIPPHKGRHGGDERTFIDAILWLGTTGAPWAIGTLLTNASLGSVRVTYGGLFKKRRKCLIDNVILELIEPSNGSLRADSIHT